MGSTMFVLTFIFLVAVVCGQRRLEEGDSCRLRTNTKGTCRVFEQCLSAQKDLEEYNTYPLICRYKPGKPRVRIVCCDDVKASPTATVSTTITTTTTTTTSTQRAIVTTSSRNIASKKCQEYSKWLAPHKTFFEEKTEPSSGQCGAYVASFIIGGTEAKPMEFPHMARLGFGEDDDAYEQLSWECGGSLISNLYILTAAHCLANRAGVPVNTVRLGHGDITAVQIRKVIKRIPHPTYNASQRYNDIALLRLDRPLEFTDFLRPACLQLAKNLNEPNGTATGWGVTENNKQSNKLLKVDLPLISHANCSMTYTVNRLLPRGIDDETMICAGSLDVKKDTCQGDSGGPLQVVLRQPYCMYSLVGITSFGIKCGIAPGVYTRVSAFVPWIEDIVWPKS